MHEKKQENGVLRKTQIKILQVASYQTISGICTKISAHNESGMESKYAKI